MEYIGVIASAIMAFILGFFFATRTKNGQKISDYQAKKPVLDIRHFLQGELLAFGTIEDFKGSIIHSFTAKIIGVWQGNSGTLTEIFTYDDGSTEQRIWTLTVEDNVNVKGVAQDIIGLAKGKQMGNALNMRYTLERNIKGKKIQFAMDDWLYLVSDSHCINKATMRKFGVVVARLTIGFQKV